MLNEGGSKRYKKKGSRLRAEKQNDYRSYNAAAQELGKAGVIGRIKNSGIMDTGDYLDHLGKNIMKYGVIRGKRLSEEQQPSVIISSIDEAIKGRSKNIKDNRKGGKKLLKMFKQNKINENKKEAQTVIDEKNAKLMNEREY